MEKAQMQQMQQASIPHPLGVNPAYLAPQPITLVFHEGISLSKEKEGIEEPRIIKSVHGTEYLHCKGSVSGLKGRKYFLTPSGHPLFSLRRSKLPFSKSWYLEEGGQMFWSLHGSADAKKINLDAEFKNILGAGYQTIFEVRGNALLHNVDIYWAGRPIARVREEFWRGREQFKKGDTYGVEVERGIDIALIAAIVVALDDVAGKKKGTSSPEVPADRRQ